MLEEFFGDYINELRLDTKLNTIQGTVLVARHLVRDMNGTYQRGVMVLSFKESPTPTALWTECLKFVRNPAELEFLVLDCGQSCFMDSHDVFVEETGPEEDGHGVMWARLKHENNLALWDDGWESNRDRARAVEEVDAAKRKERASIAPLVVNLYKCAGVEK